MPTKLPAPEYLCQKFFVSQALAHRYVGFAEIDGGVWSLHFYDRLLAHLDERAFKLRT